MSFVPITFIILCHLASQSRSTHTCNTSALCGCSRDSTILPKIQGGEIARNDTWGWIVTILFNWTNYCGGTVISDAWVVTLATCVRGYSPSRIMLSAATNQLLGWRQQRVAKAVFIHPNYDHQRGLNNVALIQVSPPFDMDDPFINRICLSVPTMADYPPINESVVAIGWGYTSDEREPATILRQVTLSRFSPDHYLCKPILVNHSVQFCAGSDDNEKNVCFGDNGGPLMMLTSSRQWTLVGITAGTSGCVHSIYPSLFTRVSIYLDWFRSINVTGIAFADTNDPEHSSMNETFSVTILNTTNSSNQMAMSVSWLSPNLIVVVGVIIQQIHRRF